MNDFKAITLFIISFGFSFEGKVLWAQPKSLPLVSLNHRHAQSMPEPPSKNRVVKVLLPDNILTSPSEAYFGCPGISDPLSDSIEAKKQALHRAFMIKGMLSEANLRRISEEFSISPDVNRVVLSNFQEYLEAFADYPVAPPERCEVVYRKLNSGEYVAWIKDNDYTAEELSKQTPFEQGIVRATIYINDNSQKRPAVYFKAMYQAMSLSENGNTENDNIDFIWYFNGKTFYVSNGASFEEMAERNLYFYLVNEKELPVESSLSVPVQEGLWPALMSCVLRQFSALSDKLATDGRIKALNETYQDQFRVLNQTIWQKKVSLGPCAIHIKQQKLYCEPLNRSIK